MEFKKFTIIPRVNKKHKDIAWHYNQQGKPYILIIKRKNGFADIFCTCDLHEKWDKVLEQNNYGRDYILSITKKYELAFELCGRFTQLKKVPLEHTEIIAIGLYNYFVSLTDL